MRAFSHVLPVMPSTAFITTISHFAPVCQVRNIVLDGNPLGVQGGRILIKVATALGHRLQMSAKNCDFSIHNSNFVFNINGEALLVFARMVLL
jgi:hypothetical protein